MSYQITGKPIRRITTTTEGYFSIAGDGSISRGFSSSSSFGYNIDNSEIFNAIFGGTSIYYVYPPQPNSTCEIKDVRSSRNRPRIPPSPPPERIMNDCCRESTKLMREIHKHLGIPELKKSGVKFPNRLIAPGAQGYSTVDNIVDFLELIVREIDHLGIHPHEVTIKDVDPSTPGDQPITAEFINATAWAHDLTKNTLKSGGTDDARLNLQVRTARLLLQTFVTAVAGKYKSDAIADFLGVPTQEFAARPLVPFDISLGERKAKGFGKSESDRDKIKKLSVKKVEALLDRFLSESPQDVVCERFDEREQSLLELLQQLVQRS